MLLHLLTHDPCNPSSHSRAAHRAAIHRRLAGSNRCSQAVTARISAPAAIISRKRLPHSYFHFIYLYRKFSACNPQEQTDDQTRPPHNLSLIHI